MRYNKLDQNKIEIIPDPHDIKTVLLAIAKHSYRLAAPRFYKGEHIHSMENEPHFEDYLQSVEDDPIYARVVGIAPERKFYSLPALIISNNNPEKSDKICIANEIQSSNKKGEELICLKMDYINQRDCRTLIQRDRSDRWIFNTYAFGQRGVTSEEFYEGIMRVNPEKFLDEVILQLEGDN